MNVWRDRFSRWFAPLARRCPLSPNAVTLLALALNVVAAGLLYRRQFIVAIVFLSIGGLADAFDGIVARVQEKTSTYGDFLDHFADRVSDVLLVTGWLLGNGVRVEITIAVIIAVLLNGYIDNGWDRIVRGGLTIAEWMSLLLVAFAVLGIGQRFALAARLQRR